MTVNTTTNRVSYAGNSATTAFAVPFPFLADADLVVIERTDSTGAEVVKSLTTHYTVTGAGGASGTVTMLVAPATGVALVIYRDPALTQLVDLVPNDPLPVETAIEQPLDRLTMAAQRNRDLIERALRLPDGDTGFVAADTKLPAKVTRAGKYLAFDAAGKPMAADVTGAVTAVSPFMATVLDDATGLAAFQTLIAHATAEASRRAFATIGTAATIAGLKAVPVANLADNDVIEVLGYYAAGDNGGGLFRWAATDSTADNGGTVIIPTSAPATGRWNRIHDGAVWLKQFGAKADGATDDQAFITKAFNSGVPLLANEGTYLLDSLGDVNAALIAPSGLWLSAYGATFKIGPSLSNARIGLLISDTTWQVGVSDVYVEGLKVDGNRANRAGAAFDGRGVFVMSSRNIVLRDVESSNNPQDGIEIGGDTGYAGGLSADVRLYNPKTDNNGRNGLSITGTRRFRCYDGKFTSSNGASPQAGVDCEPNGATSPNIDFLFVGPQCATNSGDGFMIANSATGQSGRVVSLVSVGNTLSGYNNTASAPHDVQLVGFTGSGNGSGDFSGNFATDIARSLTCKARCTFDGSIASPVAAAGSFNVASITKNGTGDYTINFAATLPDANYVPFGACIVMGGSPTTISISGGTAPGVGACRIVTQNAVAGGTVVDPTRVSVAFL